MAEDDDWRARVDRRSSAPDRVRARVDAIDERPRRMNPRMDDARSGRTTDDDEPRVEVDRVDIRARLAGR